MKPVLPIAALAVCLALPASALEVDCDSVYCFSQQDFSQQEGLRGICITDVPEGRIGAVMLSMVRVLTGISI